MNQLFFSFLKIFFRNKRALFFVIFLPAIIMVIVPFFGLGGLLRFSEGHSYVDFLLPGLVAFALMQMGIYTATYSLIDYRKTQILKRISVTPFTASQFMVAQIAARFVLGLIQACVLLLVGIVIFRVQIAWQILYLPFLIFFGNFIFLNFGFLIASTARDYEEAAPYTTIVGLGLTFLGNVFFPASLLPPVLAKLSIFFPLAPFSSLLRFSILGQKTSNAPEDFVILLLWLIVTSFLARVVFEKKAYK